jgi:hypothetical protein
MLADVALAKPPVVVPLGSTRPVSSKLTNNFFGPVEPRQLFEEKRRVLNSPFNSRTLSLQQCRGLRNRNLHRHLLELAMLRVLPLPNRLEERRLAYNVGIQY